LIQTLNRGLVEVANGDHCHLARAGTVGVELLQPIVLEALDDIRLAYRNALA